MDSQQLTVVDALAQSAFLVQGALETHAGEYDVSLIQTRLLGVLRDREPTINELAKLLTLDKSSVSGLVVRAERRGLVARKRSAADGRSVLVALTSSGRELVERVADQFGGEVMTLLAPLTAAERAQLTALLTRVIAAQAEIQGVDLG
jgi:MarR family transcriptional regulator, lower aerobic nicotinate degradation pathway regulator